MNKTIALLTILIVLVVFNSSCFAQDAITQWDTEFVNDLQKIRSQKKTGGLGYTLSEDEALEKAIHKAMDQKAPACEAMKLAVDLDFNPYNVISGIFNSGADIDLDQLCMCATEGGISKSLTASAANAAADANMLNRDEIIQSQCLNQGLAYTEEEGLVAPPTERLQQAATFSASAPGSAG